MLLPMCLMQGFFPQKELNTLQHHHPPPLRTICTVPLASLQSGTTDQILAHNHLHQLCGWQSLVPRSLGTEPAGMAFPWRFYRTRGLFQTACKRPRAPLIFQGGFFSLGFCRAPGSCGRNPAHPSSSRPSCLAGITPAAQLSVVLFMSPEGPVLLLGYLAITLAPLRLASMWHRCFLGPKCWF